MAVQITNRPAIPAACLRTIEEYDLNRRKETTSSKASSMLELRRPATASSGTARFAWPTGVLRRGARLERKSPLEPTMGWIAIQSRALMGRWVRDTRSTTPFVAAAEEGFACSRWKIRCVNSRKLVSKTKQKKIEETWDGFCFGQRWHHSAGKLDEAVTWPMPLLPSHSHAAAMLIAVKLLAIVVRDPGTYQRGSVTICHSHGDQTYHDPRPSNPALQACFV